MGCASTTKTPTPIISELPDDSYFTMMDGTIDRSKVYSYGIQLHSLIEYKTSLYKHFSAKYRYVKPLQKANCLLDADELVMDAVAIPDVSQVGTETAMVMLIEHINLQKKLIADHNKYTELILSRLKKLCD